jgi:COP9 signalosome complex subunit 2
MRLIYPETLEMSSAISNPKVMAIIKECGGKMLCSEKQWSRALEALGESFKSYVECGDSMKAKTILKYVIFA